MHRIQANQRAGRAGRIGPGVVYRLYTESAFESLADQSTPEIQRVGMAQVLLSLMALGENTCLFIDNILCKEECYSILKST